MWENPSRGDPSNETKSSSSPEAHGIEIGIGISWRRGRRRTDPVFEYETLGGLHAF